MSSGVTEGWRRLTQAARAVLQAPEAEGVVWPLTLRGTTPRGVDVVLRPLRHSDEEIFAAVRRANHAWLSPWDATAPEGGRGAPTFAELVDGYDASARAGRALPMAITVEGRLVGQVNISNIVLGSFRSCAVGYWVSRAVAGLGVVPTALALAGDHVLSRLALHRIEINIRPENTASLAVVRKLGFRDEGERARYLHIDGDWRDHRSFAITTEDLAGERLIDRLYRIAAEESRGLER